MKKKLFVVLAMMMLMIIIGSIATASAEDTSTSGTQIITINAELPTWTLEIPANVEIPFGKTQATSIGAPKITDVSPATFYKGRIVCCINHPGIFIGTGGGVGVPSFEYMLKTSGDMGIMSKTDVIICTYEYNGTANLSAELLISVAEQAWRSAPMGSYQAEMTYSSYYVDDL